MILGKEGRVRWGGWEDKVREPIQEVKLVQRIMLRATSVGWELV